MLEQQNIDLLKNTINKKINHDWDIFYYMVYGSLVSGQKLFTFTSRSSEVEIIEYVGRVGEGKNTILLTKPFGSTHASKIEYNYKLLGNFLRTLDYYEPCDEFTFACEHKANRFFKRLKKKNAEEAIKKAQKDIEIYSAKQ